MKNKIKITARAVLSALCFLTAFFWCSERVCAESGQLTHRHIGSRENGGGCYGVRKSETWDCHSYNVSVGFNGTDYIYVCGQCGSRWSSPGKVDAPRCSGQGITVYYEPNCGKNGAAAVSFSCEKSSQEWVKELDLTASYSVHEGGISISGFLWDGSPGGASLHVTENGTYTLGLTGSGNVDFSPTISVIVDHVDHTSPAIGSFQTTSDAWGVSAELLVTASDSQSGLAADAYSFDGGATWGASAAYTVTENGTYSVRVRDAAGNVSTAETSVSRIDRIPPTLSVSTSPSVDNWYDGALSVTVHAQDAEGGLADAPYSFDGGATYLVGNSATLSENGTLEIAVADKAGNIARLSFHAEKKQRPRPTTAPGGGTGSGSAGAGANTSGTGSGSTGAGANTSGTGNGSTGAGANTSGTGSGSMGAGAGGGSGSEGSGTYPVGAGGTENNSGGETGNSGTGLGGTGADSGGNAGGSGAGRSPGAGVSGIGGGNGTAAKGNQNTEGSGKNSGTGANGRGSDGVGTDSESGPAGGKDGGSGRYGTDGSQSGGMQSGFGGTLPQHYPEGLPRVGSMIGGRQSGAADGTGGMSGADRTGGSDRTGGAGGADGNGNAEGADSTDGNGNAGGAGNAEGADSTDGNGNAGEAGGGRIEDAIIQNELLASANGQEAGLLQRPGGNVWAAVRYGGAPIYLFCAIVFAAAVLCGWVLLFGIRVDTRDEKGHYRFAGITRVTTKEQERLHVVPLTKQIIRNSHTNELRIRFGALCHKRYGGETLLLRYRSMRREFKAERTVELHIWA